MFNRSWTQVWTWAETCPCTSIAQSSREKSRRIVAWWSSADRLKLWGVLVVCCCLVGIMIWLSIESYVSTIIEQTFFHVFVSHYFLLFILMMTTMIMMSYVHLFRRTGISRFLAPDYGAQQWDTHRYPFDMVNHHWLPFDNFPYPSFSGMFTSYIYTFMYIYIYTYIYIHVYLVWLDIFPPALMV